MFHVSLLSGGMDAWQIGEVRRIEAWCSRLKRTLRAFLDPHQAFGYQPI